MAATSVILLNIAFLYPRSGTSIGDRNGSDDDGDELKGGGGGGGGARILVGGYGGDG